MSEDEVDGRGYRVDPDLPWQSFAWRMLEHMLLGDSDTANALFQELVDEYGLRGVNGAMMVWADAALELLNMPHDHEDGVALKFVGTDDSAFNPDDVDPQVAWSGRMLAARAANDAEQWLALTGAVLNVSPDEVDPTEAEWDRYSSHVGVFFAGVVATVLHQFSSAYRPEWLFGKDA